jgi:hypothetical protein
MISIVDTWMWLRYPLLGTDTRPSLFPDDQTRSLFVTTDVFTLDEGCLPGVRHLF